MTRCRKCGCEHGPPTSMTCIANCHAQAFALRRMEQWCATMARRFQNEMAAALLRDVAAECRRRAKALVREGG